MTSSLFKIFNKFPEFILTLLVGLYLTKVKPNWEQAYLPEEFFGNFIKSDTTLILSVSFSSVGVIKFCAKTKERDALSLGKPDFSESLCNFLGAKSSTIWGCIRHSYGLDFSSLY